jgi:hypothetical protein
MTVKEPYMTKETFKAAKLAALERYKKRAQQDMNSAETKRQRDNAIRRYNLCIKKEQQYQAEFWTAEMEWEYSLYEKSDDVMSIPAT